MATFPVGVYAPRTKENKTGVVYDPARKTIGFAEDIVYLDNEVVAIETLFGKNDDSQTQPIAGGILKGKASGKSKWSTEIFIGVSGNVGIGTTSPANPLEVAVGGSTMFTTNQYGVGVGSVAPSNSDDFVHIERNLDSPTGILIYNRSNTANADSFIHLLTDASGPNLRINPVPTIRGGFINITAQQNTGLNLLQNSNAPINFYTNGGKKGSFLANGNFEVNPTSGINGDLVSDVKNVLNGAAASAGFRVLSDSALIQATAYSTLRGAYVNLRTAGTTGGFNILQASNDKLSLWTNNTERFRISAAGGFSYGSYVATDPGVGNMIIPGNVGIGTTSPSAKLTIVPDVNIWTGINIMETDNGNEAIVLESNATRGAIGIKENGVNKIVLNALSGSDSYFNAGNVGIGTTGPAISDGVGLHIGGKILRIGTSKTPATSGAAGNSGEICWDANYLYCCVATNTWMRATLATW